MLEYAGSQRAGVQRRRHEGAAGGVSTVTVASAEPLSRKQVADALDEAGDYHLVADAQ